MPGLLRNLALLFAAGVVSLGLGELVVRAFIVVRNVGPAFSVYDPEYGKRLRPNFSTTRIGPEFSMRLSTNSLGFRGPEPDGMPKGAIVFLGDSFTLGYGVSDGEEFPALVGARLAAQASGPVPVINAGIGNTGNGRWLKFLRGEAARYAPRAVVLQVHANDFADNLGEGMFRLEADGKLSEQPVPPPGVLRRVQQFVDAAPGLSHSYLVGLARQLAFSPAAEPESRPSHTPARTERPGERLTNALVEAAVRICASRGWPVLLVLVDVEKPFARTLRDVAVRGGASVLEIPPRSERPDLYFKVDGHWTSSGHAFVADRIVEHLQRADPLLGNGAAIP